jgi:hypothetical protein
MATYTGVNIQYPISQDIVSGKKKIETRFYPLPEKYIGVPMAIIETPGATGNFKAKIIGIVTFGKPFKYENEKVFYADIKKHLVTSNTPWAWVKGKQKWGWPIAKVESLTKPISAPRKKGIKFTLGINLD